MQSIEYREENHLILNQIYDILKELQNQIKQIILCKVLPHIGMKRNEKAYEAAKEAIYMSGMTNTDYPIQTTNLPSEELETMNDKGSRKIVLANYTTSNLTMKSGKVPKTVVGNIRLS